MKVNAIETTNFEVELSVDEAYGICEEIKAVLIKNKSDKLKCLFDLLTENIKSKINHFKI